ncbi:MAG TPA: hypothetical protein VG276_06030 [Actinomycetes bacterium]|nr:hypothetical protein [Actinomycetes bacterium]
MKSLVEHPATGLILDFSQVDFGGPEQEEVIANWQARREANLRPLTFKGDFLCSQHRDHENPWLELRQLPGQIIAAHWKGSALAGSHEIVHGVSAEHQRQVEYVQNAGEAAGFRVEVEKFLPTTKVKPDAIVYGSQADMGVEVQRSHLTVQAARTRTTEALQAGVTSVWFTDSNRNPKWIGHVPGVRLNPAIVWDRVPRPRSVSVAGVRQIVPRNCRAWPGSPCPRHSRGCSKWHPDHAPKLGMFADDLAELVPVGELVPMEFKTFGGRKLVLIVSAEGKARYESMVGHSADLPVKAAARRGAPVGRKA